MIYQNLVKQRLLKKEKIGFDQIDGLIIRAAKDLKSAKILIRTDEETA